MTEEFKRVPADAPDWTIPDETDPAGIRRRTVVLGAAWSVPVIAAAIATPLAAASVEELTLTFDGPYTAIACGPLDDVTLSVARNGTAAPGEPVTVTLPAGVTWSDGSTAPRTMTSDASGNVVLSGLLAPNSNGNFNFIAQSGTATATTQLTTVGADRGVVSTFGSHFLPQLPAGVLIEDIQTNSVSSGVYATVLGSDGNVYVSSSLTGSGTWSEWSKSNSPLAGSLNHIAVSKEGPTNLVASDTQLSFLGGDVSTPLPGGVTIVDVESFTISTGSIAVVLGSDGRAYTNTNGAGGWTGWVPTTTLAGATTIAVGQTGGGAVVANTNTVAPVGNGVASPVLPNGATITDVDMWVAGNGAYSVMALGSDGRAYSNSWNPTTRAWSAWGTSSSSLNGSIQHIEYAHTGGASIVGGSNRVSYYGANNLSAPLPNGATIAHMETTMSGGVPNVSVLGSDGRAYWSSYRDGAWTPWLPSRVGQGTLEHVAVSEAAPWTLVAGNPLC